MMPYEAKRMPLDYKIDKELLRLIGEANKKYGEYKSLLNTLEFDSSYFLDSVLLSESYKSTQIEGTQISQDEMYYLKYMVLNDDNREIQNLKRSIEYAKDCLKNNQPINHQLVSNMHKIILESVRGANKNPGQIRTTQNWIGPRGCTIDKAIFIPPAPEHVHDLLFDLYNYMNDAYIDPIFINIALSHMQFETIHAYKDGNGRLGRALIPVQQALLDSSEPILYMSEILEMYKPSYQRFLMECRNGNVTGYINFFLQCIIDQCNGYIYKIEKMKEVYKEDMAAIASIRGNAIYKMMPIITKKVVFTKNDIVTETGVSVNQVSKIINQLVELNIIVKDTSVMKKGYRYARIYDIFVGNSY